MFDTKIAVLVREDLATWQKLNVTAFLSSGIAADAPDCIGEPYLDRADRPWGRMFGQPVLIFAADREGLSRAAAVARERDLTRVAYVSAMFSTGHDAANREVFRAENPETMDLVGLAVRGPKKGIEKVTKGLRLHP